MIRKKETAKKKIDLPINDNLRNNKEDKISVTTAFYLSQKTHILMVRKNFLKSKENKEETTAANVA